MSRRLARSHSVVTRLRALSCPTSTRKAFSRTKVLPADSPLVSKLLRPTSDPVSNERLARNGPCFDGKRRISSIPNKCKVHGFTKLWKSDRSWKRQKLRSVLPQANHVAAYGFPRTLLVSRTILENQRASGCP